MNLDTYISIIIDEAQFYTNTNTEDSEFQYIDEPVELKEFKKLCKKKFGKTCIRDYGAGQFELIITEGDFQKFAQIALEYNVEFDVEEIVEF